MSIGKLTHIQCQNAKCESGSKGYKLSDGGNLYLYVQEKGKYWRLNYRFNGKQKTMAIGVFPRITLAMARDKREEAKLILDQGKDPNEEKKVGKLTKQVEYENNFENIAREWHSQNIHRWKPKHAARILIRLENNVFPFIGKRPIKAITPPELLVVGRKVEQREAYDLAHRVLQTCSQIFRYAVATGRAERDITPDLRGALKTAKTVNHARLDESELPAFLKALECYEEVGGNTLTKLGLKLLVLTFVRNGELRGASWSEIDFDKKEWRIPAERMKAKEEHIVPLCKQSIKILLQIKEITDQVYGDYLFPSRQSPRKTMSENTFMSAIKALGYKDKTTAHGFRGMASTILNENGWRADVIERQLAHSERDQVRAAYNHAQYLPERRKMMDWWGDYVENALNSSGKVIKAKFGKAV
jgi:integrase